MRYQQDGGLTPENIQAEYGIDSVGLGIDASRCQTRLLSSFPNGLNGLEAEDSGDEYFAEVIGPAVWRWARANGLDNQASVLEVDAAGLSAPAIMRLQALENYLGSTEHRIYIGLVEP